MAESRSDFGPRRAELEREQVAESRDLGLGSPGQWRGAVVGVVAGAILGGFLGAGVALALSGGAASGVVAVLMGVVFGGVAGGVYEGGRNPERAGELRTADDEPDPSTAVESNPPSPADPREESEMPGEETPWPGEDSTVDDWYR